MVRRGERVDPAQLRGGVAASELAGRCQKSRSPLATSSPSESEMRGGIVPFAWAADSTVVGGLSPELVLLPLISLTCRYARRVVSIVLSLSGADLRRHRGSVQSSCRIARDSPPCCHPVRSRRWVGDPLCEVIVGEQRKNRAVAQSAPVQKDVGFVAVETGRGLALNLLRPWLTRRRSARVAPAALSSLCQEDLP